MYVPTHYACFAAHCDLMFVASNCSTNCREIQKLEKPDCIALWEIAHANNGKWTNAESKKVYVGILT